MRGEHPMLDHIGYEVFLDIFIPFCKAEKVLLDYVRMTLTNHPRTM